MLSSTCHITGLGVPECSCGYCIRQLMAEFAPEPYRSAAMSIASGYDAPDDEPTRDAEASPVTA